MTFMDWLRAIFAPSKESTPDVAPIAARAPMSSRGGGARAIPTGRASVDKPNSIISDGWIVVPPNDYESAWRTLNLDATHLDELPPSELLDMLADLSPELSRGIWDFQRLFNPGWECKAFELGSEDTESAQAKTALDAIFDTLRAEYGACDVVWGKLSISAFQRGALCSELVLDPAGRKFVDFAVPDPHSVRFRKRSDPVRGQVWQPGQWQRGNFVPLDIPTFKYTPIDPMPGVPYGRPMAAPALFTSIFLLGLMHDVKRVVMQQGYKRMDISIDTEQALAAYQQDDMGQETFMAFVAEVIDTVKTSYGSLEPDDAFIHSDFVVLNQPAGTIDSDSIGAISDIIDKLESMITRALKSNSLLMGNDESASETDSNRRWEIHAAGIKSIQHFAENMIEAQLTTALEAQGIQARIEFRFAELRAAEELRDAQVEQLKIANNSAKRNEGWVSQDEASNAVTGHDAEEDEPIMQAAAMPQQGGDNDGQEALNQDSDSRAKLADEIRAARADVRLALAEVEREVQWSSNGHA